VGPGDHLQDMGIDVVHDLPGVGKNLQDHIAAGIFYYASQRVSLASAESAVNVLKYLLFRKGPLTSNVGEGGMFIRTDLSLDRPDLQYFFAPIHYVDHGLTKFDGHGFGCGCQLLNPQSSGQITLKSRDPQAHPAIQPCYLDAEADMGKMLYGIKLTQTILDQPAFNPYRGQRIRPAPGQINSNEEWREYIRNTGETLYHPTSTCKMGQDRMAVVDPSLKVQGIDNLRVVDASVMPSVPSGNTNAPTMMIAEKGADLIKGA
jgi:choline dehydrogenase